MFFWERSQARFDFSNLERIPGVEPSIFTAAGGAGLKDGFLFALHRQLPLLGTILPTDGLGGLRAAHVTPVLKPVAGHLWICSLASVNPVKHTDAAAGMTKSAGAGSEIIERDKGFSPHQTKWWRHYHQLLLLLWRRGVAFLARSRMYL